ncbi:hypothetical protein GBA52_007938 [Prunus armeniaca]|nr:hypothetical protein GBA52_007938 [Prunus armeniaca]
MALRSLSSFTAVRFEAPKSNGAPIPPPRHQDPLPRLSVTKPSWVVRTEASYQSNVNREVRRKPDPPCEVCTGSGRVNCHECYGTGQTQLTCEYSPKGNGQNGEVSRLSIHFILRILPCYEYAHINCLQPLLQVQDLWWKWFRLLLPLPWDWRVSIYNGLSIHEDGFFS